MEDVKISFAAQCEEARDNRTNQVNVGIPPFESVGYKAQTDFWNQITLAAMGLHKMSLEDMLEKMFEMYKDDKIAGTELAITLNWKIWQTYDSCESEARKYDAAWKKLDLYIMDNWKGDKIKYYVQTVD